MLTMELQDVLNIVMINLVEKFHVSVQILHILSKSKYNRIVKSIHFIIIIIYIF